MGFNKSAACVCECKSEGGSTLVVERLLEAMGPEINAAEIAAVLYVPETTVRRWMRKPNTSLDPYKADAFARCIGMHPFQIWKWDWVDTK